MVDTRQLIGPSGFGVKYVTWAASCLKRPVKTVGRCRRLSKPFALFRSWVTTGLRWVEENDCALTTCCSSPSSDSFSNGCQRPNPSASQRHQNSEPGCQSMREEEETKKKQKKTIADRLHSATTDAEHPSSQTSLWAVIKYWTGHLSPCTARTSELQKA